MDQCRRGDPASIQRSPDTWSASMEPNGEQSREDPPVQRVQVSVSVRTLAILIGLAALIAMGS